jgi:hypothetical protein
MTITRHITYWLGAVIEDKDLPSHDMYGSKLLIGYDHHITCFARSRDQV